MFGKTFYSVGEIIDWVSRLPVGQSRVDVWVDIVNQLSRFFRSGSALSLVIVKTVRTDKSFSICQWWEKDLIELLEPLEFHLEADEKIRDRASEALVTIRDNWGCEVADMIECKGYFNRVGSLGGSAVGRSQSCDCFPDRQRAGSTSAYRV